MEDALFLRLVAGDRTAFKEFYEIRKSAVFTLCFRLAGNREDAEDLTQEVFVKAWSSAREFRFQAELSTWLYRIAVNLYLDKARRSKFKRWLSLDSLSTDQRKDSQKDPTAASRDNPGEWFERKETERILRRAMDGLPKRQKTALVLRHDGGFAYSEIAKMMNLSVASVESLIFRAKKALACRIARFLNIFS